MTCCHWITRTRLDIINGLVGHKACFEWLGFDMDSEM